MSTSHALLGLLEKEPSYGYDLKRDYDSLFGKEKPLAFGQVYATLSRLSRDGQIRVKGEETAEGPARKLYAITDQGQDDLDGWLASAEAPEPHMQAILFVKVVLALLLDHPASEYLDTQRAAHLERMRHLTKLRRHKDLAQSLRADYAIFHLEADLRWMDLTAARLDSLAKEILK